MGITTNSLINGMYAAPERLAITEDFIPLIRLYPRTHKEISKLIIRVLRSFFIRKMLWVVFSTALKKMLRNFGAMFCFFSFTSV